MNDQTEIAEKLLIAPLPKIVSKKRYYVVRDQLVCKLLRAGASYRDIAKFFKEQQLPVPNFRVMQRILKSENVVTQSLNNVSPPILSAHEVPVSEPAVPIVPVTQSTEAPQNSPLPPPPASEQPIIFRKDIDDSLPEKILHCVHLEPKNPDEVYQKTGFYQPDLFE